MKIRLTWNGNLAAEKESRKAFSKFSRARKKRKEQQQAKRQKKPRRVWQYAEYMSSSVWRRRRRRFIAKYGRICNRCRSTRNIEVHHRNYDRLGRERDRDLEVLCRVCHGEDGLAQALGISAQSLDQYLLPTGRL